jgi:hypothetical protein
VEKGKARLSRRLSTALRAVPLTVRGGIDSVAALDK